LPFISHLWLISAAGLISAGIATSGGIFFALLAIGGLGGAIGASWNLFQGETNEEETRERILQSYMDQMRSFVNSSKFSQFAEEQLGNWLTVVDEVREVLSLNLLEVHLHFPFHSHDSCSG